ncbi:MAG: arsenate reductase family protein [Clostridium sp.]|nr:arsenate reductase family protein [Clostridium sp.]
MKALFLQYAKCSTCVKAKKWLEANDIVYEDRPIVEQPPTIEELKQWVAKSGLPLKKFFNTSGLVYKSLNLKEKLPSMTEEEQYAILASDGKLVKRPIVVQDDLVLVGFKEEEWKQLKN